MSDHVFVCGVLAGRNFRLGHLGPGLWGSMKLYLPLGPLGLSGALGSLWSWALLAFPILPDPFGP